jgi:predicted transcriptional regulator
MSKKDHIVGQFKERGLKINAWCERNEIAVPTFYRWLSGDGVLLSTDKRIRGALKNEGFCEPQKGAS